MTNDTTETVAPSSESADKGILHRVKDWLSTEEQCEHHEIAEVPDTDESIWYVRDETVDRTYWSETDVAYVKLQQVTRTFICLGCGEERTVNSAERVGGDAGLKVKSEMDQGEQTTMEETVHSGAFYNGFPDDHPWGGARR